MNERLKQIRKALDLTQQEFADKLGIARGNISAYEVGKNLPSDAVISLICKTDFSKGKVSEEWLRTGAGEMFLPVTRDDEIAKLTADLFKSEKDSFKARLILALSKLDESEWGILEELAKDLATAPKKKD